jgi:mRNA deadenylase 3'-5' endonuclease subunit Ccr4
MENNAAKDPFRVMTYNLLSEMYTSNEVQTKAAYSYLSDMKFLDIGYRAQRIVDEIRVSATDVLCLQEVDLKLFHRYLEPYLCYHGSVLVVPPAKNPSSPEEEGSVIGAIDADGAYQAMGPSTSGHYYGRYTNKNSGTMEGCAIFVNMNRFRVVYELDVPLGLAVLSDPQLEDLIQRRPSLMDILGARVGTIAQIVVLQDLKALNEVIVVANSHFYYHPSANHIRLMHMKAVVDIIAEIRAIILNEQRSLSAADYLYQFDSLLDYTPRYMKSTSYLLSTFAQDAVCRFHGFQESVVAPSLHLSVPLGDAGFDDKLREQSRSPRWHACPGSRVSILLVGDLNSRPKTPALEFLDRYVCPCLILTTIAFSHFIST